MIKFNEFELDRDRYELRRNGRAVKLERMPMELLILLVAKKGHLVTRLEIIECLWGNEVFIDSEHGINTAVRKLRQALRDDPEKPRFVETVTGKGYRFIAQAIDAEVPAAAENNSQTEEPTVVNLGSTEGPARPGSHKSPSRTVVLAVLTIAGVLAAIGITTMSWLRQPRKPILKETRLIKSYGWEPVLSRDGKLFAYSSVVGGGEQHIWVQQTAGGEAIQVTTGPDKEMMPDFSPDGTHIAFFSLRNGGGIYIAPTLPGEPRLLVATPNVVGPRFSPRGDSILYLQDRKLFTVSVNGGQPTALPLNRDFLVYSAPIWAPNGKEILLYGVRSSQQNEAPSWWIVPLDPGQVTPANLPGVAQNYSPSYSESAFASWVRTAEGHEWIIYSTADLENWKLWRIGISPGGVIKENPELLSSGNGILAWRGSVSEDGKLAYAIFNSNASISSIFQISISDRGQKLGPTFQLALAEGGSYKSPSLSRDGKWMAYDAYNPGKPNTILLRDLSTGKDHILDEDGRGEIGLGDQGETSISPDGSRVIFERDSKAGRLPDDRWYPFPDGFIDAAVDGRPEQICERCTPRGFSSDGSVVLLQKYDRTDQNKDRIVALDLPKRTVKDFLSDQDKSLYHPFFSWDDRWVVFEKLESVVGPVQYHVPAQILIAPVRHGAAAGQAEWIAVTDGRNYDDKPQFSPDGNTIYFTSTRDGYLCIWAQRLDPVTKHPLRPPFGFEHFHNSDGRAAAFHQSAVDLTVARDKILINLLHIQPDIWMTQMQ